jgi:hypothetical protein
LTLLNTVLLADCCTIQYNPPLLSKTAAAGTGTKHTINHGSSTAALLLMPCIS